MRDHSRGVLKTQAGAPSAVAATGLQKPPGGILYVPGNYSAERPWPLVVCLHGAGGNAQHGIDLLKHGAEADGFLLLATGSKGRTWDVILDEFGPDVAALDAALQWTFERYNASPARVAIGGFSDGASYALSLGVTNGDLFRYVLAFSPGFLTTRTQAGSPIIYVSHGKDDKVLPIDRCSRRVVPMLRRAGYDVHYREFEGGHTVPAGVRQEAIDLLLGPHRNTQSP